MTEECTFLKMYNITEKDYHYWRKSNMLNQWVKSHYHGTFFQDGGLGSMNVSDLSAIETTPFEVMKLMYADKNCSVFFVTPLENDAPTVCELYVRNKSVSSGPSTNCTDYYNQQCNTTIVLYNSTCQDAATTG
nr:uncharacterized protein LOC126543872 [Dermacentor andersoni]